MSLIHTKFGFDSTAADVAAGIDLTGRRAIVTGASSGLGVETARVLTAAGAEVTLAVRDVDAGERAAKEIDAADVKRLDLADQASVAAFADSWTGPLHILVNNAGIMASPEQYTAQGWEMQLATNHLGHFALATALHPALKAAGNARIVVVSSTAHMLSPFIFDDPNFDFRRYDPWLAYGQSKTANVLFAVEASRRWAADGITANAAMPGAIFTNLQRHTGGAGSGTIPPELMKTVEQGAATSVLVATSPLLEGVGGRYFADCNEAETLDRRGARLQGVARYAVDPENARRLWELSRQMLDA
ncbi:SDR family NAD(P)-dependent oxidoreductase [Kutzneria sp. 744]|uniref:SDR family NAD(P)-dependent oxidoreductase n=1 Tax=Kutzneria sp. (strain 744) TaxID=345341 RepID=UPI0003EEC985|nr:SDR family NAD(P)-dependent oxidoreductase [Kutzneria sp. 744]EWM18341.1 short-chain dehydrogenase/reductase family oxidoreductase [Kutzneria sp. 744]